MKKPISQILADASAEVSDSGNGRIGSMPDIAKRMAEKTFKELGFDMQGNPLPKPSHKLPANSHKLPFRIPALDKTHRQATKTTGYKASATWQTASLLRDLLSLWFNSHPPVSPLNLPLFSRLKAQVVDAARSVTANIEEGWARPTTKEYITFLGYSEGSLNEIRGDLDRMLRDNLIKPKSNLTIPTPSRNYPYPPIASRQNPTKYGSLREQLREYTGKTLNPNYLSFEIFTELTNKTNFLLKRTVIGLQNRLITNEKQKLESQLQTHRRKYW